MPPRQWTFRVRDILDSIQVIEEYVRGMTYKQFARDRKTVDAATRNMITIGEAAGHVPDAIQERFPEVPWDNMRRMRNVVVHIYFGVDLPIVWKTIQEDLPPLKGQLAKVLQDAERDD